MNSAFKYYFSFSVSLHQFETRKNSWLKLAPMNVGRRNHVIVSVGHCLYVLGGLNNEVGNKVVPPIIKKC